jgi:polyisoprenoid-binding protein YceI
LSNVNELAKNIQIVLSVAKVYVGDMTRLSMLILPFACAAMRLSAQSYLGTWALVLVDRVAPDGNRTHLYGDSPEGVMTLDADGRYTMQILKAGRPKFASGSRLTGTPDENQQAVQGANSHFGRYVVDDRDHSITFHVDHAFFPNWEGTDQKCELTIADDRLTIIQPTTGAGGNSTGEIVWRRVDGPSLAGTWTLTAADEIRPDGSHVHAYGENPEGQLIFDEAGHYSVWISRAMHSTFKSGEKSRGTADEYRAATLEISSHYGRYTVDAANHTITFDIVHASFPNLDGVEEKRPYELTGDALTWRLPPRSDGTIPISSWRRTR